MKPRKWVMVLFTICAVPNAVVFALHHTWGGYTLASLWVASVVALWLPFGCRRQEVSP